MADNYTENKNNILFQLLSELVMRGWFNEIELMFGPVGHTHNGNDAVHRWHNQGVGNHMSFCAAEFFDNYKKGFPSQATRPHPRMPVQLEREIQKPLPARQGIHVHWQQKRQSPKHAMSAPFFFNRCLTTTERAN